MTVREVHLLTSGLKFSSLFFCYFQPSHQLMLLRRHRIGSELLHSSGILILLKHVLNFENKLKNQTYDI